MEGISLMVKARSGSEIEAAEEHFKHAGTNTVVGSPIDPLLGITIAVPNSNTELGQEAHDIDIHFEFASE